MGAKSPIQPVGPESWRNIPSEPFIGIPRSVKLCAEEKKKRICGLHKNVRKVRRKSIQVYIVLLGIAKVTYALLQPRWDGRGTEYAPFARPSESKFLHRHWRWYHGWVDIGWRHEHIFGPCRQGHRRGAVEEVRGLVRPSVGDWPA